MKKYNFTISFFFLFIICFSQTKIKNVNSISSKHKFVENYIIKEAEDFDSQTLNEKFKWFKFTAGVKQKIKGDEDKPHYLNSSNDSFMEVLPAAKEFQKIKVGKHFSSTDGKNFFRTPGKMAIIKYKINFKSAGRYYVWVKGFSNHKHDNSMHVGLDGEWPESGKALYWCESNRGKWNWSGFKQQKSDGCHSFSRSKRIYLDVKSTGIHYIQFSMREFGLEFDKFILTKIKSKNPTPSKF